MQSLQGISLKYQTHKRSPSYVRQHIDIFDKRKFVNMTDIDQDWFPNLQCLQHF